MKMIKIVLKKNEDLEATLNERKNEMSIHLTECLLEALENNVHFFEFAKVEIEGQYDTYTLACRYEDYLDSLKVQLKNLLEMIAM